MLGSDSRHCNRKLQWQKLLWLSGLPVRLVRIDYSMDFDFVRVFSF